MGETTTESIALDKQDWAAQHAAIWGSHEWPTGTVMSICSQAVDKVTGVKGAFRGIAAVPMSDASAAWDVLATAASKGDNVWVGVGGLQPGYGPGRGKKADVVALPALFVDIDFISGSHSAGDRNPTKDQAQRWIDAAPPATVKVFTGGGVHLYFVLDDLLDPHTPDGAALLEAHKNFWMQLAAEDVLNIDAGVLADAARILRPAGTWNSNQGRRTRLEFADGPRYSTTELLTRYPEASTPEPRRTKTQGSGPLLAAAGSAPGTSERVGDRFALTVPVSVFAEAVFGAEERPQNGLTFPGPDGDLGPLDSARIYRATNGEPERLTIFDTAIQSVFGLDGQNHSWSSFDLLAHAFGGPTGYRRAARLVADGERGGTWPLPFFTSLAAVLAPDVLRAFGVKPAPQTVSLAPAPVTPIAAVTGPQAVVLAPMGPRAGDATEAADEAALLDLLGPASTSTPVAAAEAPLTIARAVADRVPARFELEDGLRAYIWDDTSPGEIRHGIYKTVRFQLPDLSHGERLERISSWVAFKSRKTEQLTVDTQGRKVIAAEAKVTVTLARSDGRVRTQAGFTTAEAHSAKTVVDRLDVGVSLPISTVAREQVGNALRELGTDGGTDVVEAYGTLGWLKPDTGGWTYLAPAGSVNAQGTVPGFTVGSPPRSEEDSLLEAQLAYGFPDLPSDATAIRTAASAIPAFLAITPTSHAAFAMLGLAFAAPLALSERTSVFLVSPPDAGKTQLLRAFQAFLTGNAHLSSWTGSSLPSATALGASITAKWARHAVSIHDDFRVPQDRRKADVVNLAVANVVQASYGGAGSGAKSTVDGGLKTASEAETCAIISGEALPGGGVGVLSRILAIDLPPGAVAMTPRDESPFDTFREAHPAGAQALYGAYIHFLASRLDTAGTLRQFRTTNERLRAENAPRAGRSASNASVVGAGWAMLRLFAETAGFADLVPTQEDVVKALDDLAGANAALVLEANPGQAIVNAARDTIASKTGHIALHDGSMPTGEEATRLGWQWTARTATAGVYEPTRFEVGVLSEDRQYVVLRNQAVTDLKRRNPALEGLPMGQLNAGFLSLVKDGTTPGSKAPRTIAGETRPRGYVLPASAFDL